MFNEKLKPATKVEVLQTCIPRVEITTEALSKMHLYVDNCTDEIGWLGTAYRDGNVITINDVFLFDQEVHSTTTEITPEGLGEFAKELLQREDGMEIWNNMKVWGHSHVNMATSPSGQDNSQMATFAKSGHDWFIRIIANKKNDLKVDLYEYTSGIIYNDLPWEEQMSEEEAKINNMIAELYTKLESIKEKKLEDIKTPILEEMKVKVKKKTYTQTGFQPSGYWTNRNYLNPNGGTGMGTITKLDDKKKQNTSSTNATNKEIIVRGGLTGEEIEKFFDYNDLLDIGQCYMYHQASAEIEELVPGYFDYDDRMNIWDYAREIYKDYIKGR